MVTCGLRWAGGFVLVTHGLVHLLIWPGAPLGTSGDTTRLRWNGTSWSWVPGWMPPAAVSAVGGTLLAAAVLGCLFGGLALLGLPVAHRFPLSAAGTGAVCSLLLFALIWPGLEPDPAEFAAGAVLSAALLAGVCLTLLARRWRRRSSSPAEPGGPAGPEGAAAPPAQDRQDRQHRRQAGDTVRSGSPSSSGTPFRSETLPWPETPCWPGTLFRPGTGPTAHG
ncbi:hypothetical protein [Parafrankia sp. FMc2]|uniref:hypothetical protein n=1 Tax=Parafrankia sp. FMc2 TaxID=3233196 RepID=UPI0034D3A311